MISSTQNNIAKYYPMTNKMLILSANSRYELLKTYF